MAKKKPAILKITQPYALIPKLCSSTLPRPMMELYNPQALHMGYLSLLEACESAFQGIKVRLTITTYTVNNFKANNFFVQITADQVAAFEVETRGQSSNKIWFMYRAGRITASNIKSAARTNHSMPSQSLIKRICYPEAFKFSTKATRYDIGEWLFSL